ncbi:MAG: hypothetical protein EZS28_030214 [Streblomastix strix]|uniref:Uncharacterized protein n=1 Tax=Streblomastix strix TaxID=222440 RepID=A0A5J4UUZ7_9EUKA|nr:MAG: hypothetical protein EZS28_030214 [Streblomastix strix]
MNEHQNYLDEYWNVDRNEYYVQDSGSDDWLCTSSNPCKTNLPLDNTHLSTILIKSVGRFNITGKAVFYLINFIMESTGYQNFPGIYGLSSIAEIELQDCQFNMQNAGSQIGKCFINLQIGGNNILTNLNTKDISSEENIIKVNFNDAGSLSISNSQFENITKIGSYAVGGVINALLTYESNRLDITNCQFTTCKAQNTWGGAVYAEIQHSNAQITLSYTQLIQCEAQKGGGLHIKSSTTGQVVLDNSCEFKQCIATSGNGGGICADLEYSTSEQSLFLIKDVLIQDCQALLSSYEPISTGFGGGIFIGVRGTYNSSTQSLDLKGMKIYGNSAIQGGQSLYVIMNQLKEWCEYGLLGEYVKGNYSDTDSDENDLQGLVLDFSQFASSSQQYIQTNEKTLENYWGVKIPSFSIWHIQQRFLQQNGTNTKNCGETNSPCQTIEYAIQQISVNVGGAKTVFIEEKNIGISQYGFDIINPLQLNKSNSYTEIIKIMKQMYGTSSEMTGNAEIKIIKNNDNNKENGKFGWISTFEGIQLHLYSLNIIMDNSQLLIPIIYIQDSNSLLELNTITFTGIKLSPTTEAKGIIQINYDNSQLIALNCIFSNIQISSKGGNAIRILNNGSQPIISNIKGCQFNNISSISDSNGRGGSAIYMENKHGSILIIEESCKFQQCIIEKGNGGAIYIEIDFTSSKFEFKINNTIIQECQTKSDTSSDVPPTGYGGGIFLTGSGDYDISSKRLDLKGMKIYGNSADKSGQSLYVAMTQLAEWCRTGIAGEYVKGNYSDRFSQFEDIEGIQVDQTTFNSLSLESIQEQQSILQYYWAEISNLTKISAILNTQDINQPLQINLEATPILIEGDPHSLQTASFGMKDISWFDYDNKEYGIFVSNDRRIFTGVEGKQDQAYPLEIIIEKDDDGKTTHFPWKVEMKQK